jgi:hypothetical protein
MFNLEDAIGFWRRQMLAAGINTPVPLEELENHLRDEVEQQMQSGLSAQQAFEIAARRIGEASALKHEFRQVNGWGERKQMKRVVAIISALFGMVFGLSLVLPQLGQWGRTGAMPSLTFFLLGMALILVGGSSAFYGIRTHRDTRGQKWIRVAILLACGFYAMPFIFAFFQSRETSLMGWVFCAGLAAASILFFGSCFSFSRRFQTRPVHET